MSRHYRPWRRRRTLTDQIRGLLQIGAGRPRGMPRKRWNREKRRFAWGCPMSALSDYGRRPPVEPSRHLDEIEARLREAPRAEPPYPPRPHCGLCFGSGVVESPFLRLNQVCGCRYAPR